MRDQEIRIVINELHKRIFKLEQQVKNLDVLEQFIKNKFNNKREKTQ